MQLFSSSLPQWLVASTVRGISCTENLGTYGGSFPPMGKARRLIMRVRVPMAMPKGPGMEGLMDQARATRPADASPSAVINAFC